MNYNAYTALPEWLLGGGAGENVGVLARRQTQGVNAGNSYWDHFCLGRFGVNGAGWKTVQTAPV